MIFILEVMYPSNMRITSRFQMRSASSKLFSNWHSIIKCILSDSIEWKLIILGSQESNNSSPISTKVIDYEIPFQWLKRRINERRVQNKRSTSRVLITVPKKKKEIIGKFNADHSCVHVDHRYLSVMDHLSSTRNRLNRVYDNRDRELHRLADGSNMRVWIGFPRNPSRWKLNLRGIERTNHFERSCKSTVIFVISYIGLRHSVREGFIGGSPSRGIRDLSRKR